MACNACLTALHKYVIIILRAVYAEGTQKCWSWTQACEKGKEITPRPRVCADKVTPLPITTLNSCCF